MTNRMSCARDIRAWARRVAQPAITPDDRNDRILGHSTEGAHRYIHIASGEPVFQNTIFFCHFCHCIKYTYIRYTITDLGALTAMTFDDRRLSSGGRVCHFCHRPRRRRRDAPRRGARQPRRRITARRTARRSDPRCRAARATATARNTGRTARAAGLAHPSRGRRIQGGSPPAEKNMVAHRYAARLVVRSPTRSSFSRELALRMLRILGSTIRSNADLLIARQCVSSHHAM